MKDMRTPLRMVSRREDKFIAQDDDLGIQSPASENHDEEVLAVS